MPRSSEDLDNIARRLAYALCGMLLNLLIKIGVVKRCGNCKWMYCITSYKGHRGCRTWPIDGTKGKGCKAWTRKERMKK